MTHGPHRLCRIIAVLRLLLALPVLMVLGASPGVVRAEEPQDIRVMDAEALTSYIKSQTAEVTLVNFWAVWCAPCRREIPGLIELRRGYGPERLAMLGLAVQSKTAAVEQYTALAGINYPVAVADDDSHKAHGVSAIPSLRLYQNGEAVLVHDGYLAPDKLRDVVRQLLDN